MKSTMSRHLMPSIKSLVFNAKFLLFVLVTSLILLTVSLYQVTKQEQIVQAATQEEEAVLVLREARQDLDKELVLITKERGKVDANPDGPTNPGIAQELATSLGVEMRTRINKMIGDPKGKWYNHAPWKVWRSMRENSMSLIVAAETNQRATLTYIDPRSGKEVTTLLDSEVLATIGLTRLNAINAAQYSPRIAKANLTAIRTDIAAQEFELIVKNSIVSENQGLPEVATEMLRKDVYGNSTKPDKAVYKRQAQKNLDAIRDRLNPGHNTVSGSPH